MCRLIVLPTRSRVIGRGPVLLCQLPCSRLYGNVPDADGLDCRMLT